MINTNTQGYGTMINVDFASNWCKKSSIIIFVITASSGYLFAIEKKVVANFLRKLKTSFINLDLCAGSF